MNWANYDRLVNYLTDLIERAPQEFNYMEGFRILENGGCVDCHCRVLMGTRATPAPYAGSGESIRRFLDITDLEALAMWSPSLCDSSILGAGRAHRGEPGIREALRRLSVLATRYERPASADPMPASLRATLNDILSSSMGRSGVPEVPHAVDDTAPDRTAPVVEIEAQ